jgi:hypothetical protein
MNSFKTGTTYPLVEQDRFDDDYGEGYGFARVAGDLHDLPMTMVDCWIVNREGDRHPGYDECPVPVRIQDVDEANAFASPAVDYVDDES